MQVGLRCASGGRVGRMNRYMQRRDGMVEQKRASRGKVQIV
jgi:hypothetical protein